MATDDTTTTTVDVNTSDVNDNLNQVTQNIKKVKEETEEYTKATGTFFSNLISKMANFDSAGKSQISLSGDMAKGFDIITQAIFGATNAYNDFNAGFNNSSSFTSQMQVLEKAGNLTSDVMKKLAISMGAPGDVINGSDKVLKTFITNLAAGADQALKFQGGFLQMMGAAGGLDAVFAEAGNGAQDLNKVLLKQSLMISDIAGASGKSSQEVAGFYKQLGEAIPKSVTSEVTGVNQVTGRSFDTLKDAMALAAGTGRDTSAVIKDMTTAWETYGLSGEDALKFTSQMSDLSNKFGINLSYTEGFIKKNAEAFQLLSDGADDGAQSFNRWYKALEGTGLSAKQSSDIISRMTGQMANLTIAQKAFLSAQSGGPGGLRGALQIENLLREGKVDEVLAKAEEAIKKQFGGKIYSQAEAQTSDFAASQFVRQRQVLQSGAFGGLAKNDQDATRILEAFKAGTKPSEALKSPEASLNDNLKRGEDIQSKQLTQLSRLTNVAERQLAQSSNTTLEKIQKLIGVDGQNEASKNLKNYTELMNSQMLNTGALIKERKNVDVDDVRNKNLSNGLDTLDQYLPDALKPVINAVKTRVLGQTAVPNPGDRYAPPGKVARQALNKSLSSNNTTPTNLPNNNQTQTQQAPQQQASQQVDVTVRGLCINCAKPINPDPTTVAITSGTVGAKK